jgi:hypothetical protein
VQAGPFNKPNPQNGVCSTVEGVKLLSENDLKAVSELCTLAGHF